MIAIATGYGKNIKKFDSSREYVGDEILQYLLGLRSQPIWLYIDGKTFPLEDISHLELASEIVACYHNEVFSTQPPDDGWDRETQEMEDRAEQHMLDSPDSLSPRDYTFIDCD
jgi:hypothetical protein